MIGSKLQLGRDGPKAFLEYNPCPLGQAPAFVIADSFLGSSAPSWILFRVGLCRLEFALGALYGGPLEQLSRNSGAYSIGTHYGILARLYLSR